MIDGDRPKAVRISRLIAAASQHLANHGDTPVHVVLSTGVGEGSPYLYPATDFGAEKYGDDGDGTWYFEIGACAREDADRL